METTTTWLDGWRLSPLALPMLLSLCEPPLEAQTPALTDPAAIDHAVATFTGAPIGAPGGARMAIDSRLRLAPCQGALAVSWHGAARNAVAVECPGPTSWRIFVAIAPQQGAAPGATRAAAAIKRGDAITLVVRGPGFSVQKPGEALEAGNVGDWILVRTTPKSEGLRARIARPGLVIIPAG